MSVRTRGLVWLLALCAAGAGVFAGAEDAAAQAIINELRIDQEGTDNDEFFELAGTPSTSLTGLTYIVLGDGPTAGDSGVIEAVIDLTGQTIPGSGYFVAAEATFSLAAADLTTDLNFENSDNVTHMLVSGFSGLDGDDLDTDDDGTLDVTPWTAIVDSIAAVEVDPPVPGVDEHVYGAAQVGPTSAGFAPAHLHRVPDQSANWIPGPFSTAGGDDTPGAANAQGTGACCTGATCVASQRFTQCEALMGEYQGAGVSCTPNPCVGGCCISDVCTPGFLEADCLAMNGVFLGGGSDCSAGCPDFDSIAINEVRTDQPSTGDPDEYFELAGPPGFDLSGLTYLVIGDGAAAAGSGVIEEAVDLSGQVIPGDGRFLVAEDGDTLGAVADFIPAGGLNFEDSDNVTHMLVSGFNGAVGDDLDTDNNCTLDVTPWVAIHDRVALVEELASPPTNTECHYGTGVGDTLGPDDGFVPGHVFRLDTISSMDGLGTPWNIGPFDPITGDDTPGEVNALGVGACCDGDTCTQETRDDCEAMGFVYRGTGLPCDMPNPCALACSTIQDAKGAALGTGMRLCDLVITTTVDTTASLAVADFRVQDMSGMGGMHTERGLTVFGSTAEIGALLTGVGVGDSISLEGVTGAFNGLLQIQDGVGAGFPLVRVGTGVGVLPPPVVVTCGDFADGNPVAEELESVRVKLNCVAFMDPVGTFVSGTNYFVTDGSDTCTVRAVGGMVDGTPIPTELVSLSLVGSQFDSTDPFDGGYQLLLLEATDIGAPDCGGADVNACCFFDASCRELTPAICTALSGADQGAPSDCTQVQCPLIDEGACCLPTDMCQDAMTLPDCVDADGAFLDVGSTCLLGGCNLLFSVAEARAASLGTDVRLRKVTVASTTDLVNSGSVKNFQVQDNSGPGGEPRGITIFGGNAAIDGVLAQVVEGSVIQIRGTTDAFNGLSEIDAGDGPFELVQIYNDPPVIPTPTPVTPDDLIDMSPTAEGLESTLVRLQCVEFVAGGTGNFAGSFNYNVTDGVNTVVVRIATTALDIVGTPIPTGEHDIIGVVGQFDNVAPPNDSGYQLQPRSLADIVPLTCQTTPGDVNGDGLVNLLDVPGFVASLLSDSPAACADVNGDTVDPCVAIIANGLDVQPFVDLVQASATVAIRCCPSPPAECDPTCAGDVDGWCHWQVSAETVPCVSLGLGVAFSLPCVAGSCPAEGTMETFTWVDGNGPGMDCVFTAEKVDLGLGNGCSVTPIGQTFNFD